MDNLYISFIIAVITSLLCSFYVLFKNKTRFKIPKQRSQENAIILNQYNTNVIKVSQNKLSEIASISPHLKVEIDEKILKQNKDYYSSLAVQTQAWIIVIDVCKRLEDNELLFTIITINKTKSFKTPEFFQILKSVQVKSSGCIEVEVYKDIDP